MFLFFTESVLQFTSGFLRGDTINNTELLLSFRYLAKKYGKSYSADSFVKSFNTYKNNLLLIEERNAKEKTLGGSAIHSINHLFDRTMPGNINNTLTTTSEPEKYYTVEKYLGGSQVVNWANKYTTQVKDEMNCWSCWAFPVSEQIESDAIRTLGFTTNDVLSAQQLISCTYTNHGCADGTINNAYNYVKKHGLQRASSYPLVSSITGRAGRCLAQSNQIIVGLSSYHYLRKGDEEQIANYLLSTGKIHLYICVCVYYKYIFIGEMQSTHIIENTHVCYKDINKYINKI